MYDIAIIGAGIIGSFLARDLSRYELKVAVLEKDSDVANEATMANSAIVHSGHDPKEGTLKARLNVRGNRMYEAACKELGVTFLRTSALVAAVSEEEQEILRKLYLQAQSRQIPVYWLDRQEAAAKEPNLSDAVQAAIELPTTGIIYPWEVAIALMEEAILNGTELFLEREVTAIEQNGGGFLIKAGEDTIQSRFVINAAGLYADRIYEMVSGRRTFTIRPRKGEYYVLDKQQIPLVSRVIYPVPSEKGKGVLVVPTTHGNTLLGPDSAFIEDREDNRNTLQGLKDVRTQVQKTVKNIPMNRVIRTFTGLRPTGDTGDFIIEEASDVPQFIQAAAIESPGLASAPAISEYILQEILAGKIEFREKKEYRKRKPPIVISSLNEKERDRLVRENPSYARVICRCEQITEGEIVDCIRRPLGATTVKGVKKRVRPGMGRCQGGFCEPLVMEILAREQGIAVTKVRLDGRHSTLLAGETKGDKEE